MDDKSDEYAIILFYRYRHVEDPCDLLSYLRTLCISLGLLGRVLVSPEGINGTLSGSVEAVTTFTDCVVAEESAIFHALFANIDWKFSRGYGKIPFNDLHMKESKELISCGEMRTFIDRQVCSSMIIIYGLDPFL
jgi:UPF0176 protein